MECGGPKGGDPDDPAHGGRLVVTPGEARHLHLQIHLEHLSARDGMAFATGTLTLRENDGSVAFSAPEALALYVPAPEGGALDHALDFLLPDPLPPARYLAELAVVDGLSGARSVLKTTVDLPWPLPVLPPGFGLVAPLAGEAASGPAAARAGEEVMLRFLAHDFSAASTPGGGRSVWLTTDLSLWAAGAKAGTKLPPTEYRTAGVAFPPLLELDFRITLPAELTPGAYEVRLEAQDRLGGDVRAAVRHALRVEPARLAMGPPTWARTELGPDATTVRARLPVAGPVLGAGLDVRARIVGSDGTVLATSAAPAHLASGADGSPREVAVTLGLPAALPAVPLRLVAEAAPPGAGDAGTVGGEWALPAPPLAPAPLTAAMVAGGGGGTPSAPRLELVLGAGDVSAGAAVPFDVRLVAPPAPFVDEARAPGVRRVEVVFGAVLLDAAGVPVFRDGKEPREARASVADNIAFVPREVGVAGALLTPPDLPAGTYTLRVSAHDPRAPPAAPLAWSIDAPLHVRR
ncbi:MAG TPA: hypothetical protein VG389_01480 [Myxococcota bacterium]|jgi:hypothetical protein|nr:hypothetical protein [Myxococcota bacterium]